MSISMIGAVAPAIAVVIALLCFAVGIGGGIGLYKLIATKKLGKTKSNAVRIIEEAYAEAKTIKKEASLEAKEESHKYREEVESDLKNRRNELAKSEERLTEREKFIENKELSLDRKSDQIEEEKKRIEDIKLRLNEELEKEQQIKADMLANLEKISGMTKSDAKNMLVSAMTEDAKKEAGQIIKRIEDEAREEGDKKAREIVAGAIQKCATDLSTEMTVSVVPLPTDEMKGRIIGREGRNIRAIESATGVELIVDDTPESITVSSFDPIRREIARLSLEKLVVDGRIHPTRIEEIVEKMTKEVDKAIKEAGEKACEEVGIFNLHPELVKILGRLKFRTSYGQNALKHSIETAILAGQLATELGADAMVAKRGGLLHDIGKALDHEIEGTHVQIGMDLATKYKENPAVIHCIEAHHFNVEFRSVEAILVQIADAISSSRPGARRESFEAYIKRLQQLEEISNSFKGVDKAFAVQAGREVRIIVKPDQISDNDAMFLAKEIAKRIEDEMQYPGQIKVNVIRENRFTETAK